MNRVRLIAATACLAVVALIVGCEEDPTEPLAGFEAPAPQLSHGPDFCADRPNHPHCDGEEDEGDGGEENGGKEGNGDVLYRIEMFPVAGDGAKLLTAADAAEPTESCNEEGYIVAKPEKGGPGKSLVVRSSDPPPGPSVLLEFADMELGWARDSAVVLVDGTEKTTETSFDDECFGWTTHKNGRFAIFYEKHRGQPTLRYQWHFDYYTNLDVGFREHYTLRSEKLPLPSDWDDHGDDDDFTGEGTLEGPMELDYHHSDGGSIIDTRTFRFYLKVTKEP